MPVDNSRLKGFYKLSVKERREMVAELANLDQEAVDALAAIVCCPVSPSCRLIVSTFVNVTPEKSRSPFINIVSSILLPFRVPEIAVRPVSVVSAFININCCKEV